MRAASAAALALAFSAAACAQDDVATPDGDAALAACLADRDSPRACLGVVARACFDRPGSETTAGSVRCNVEEEAAWEVMRLEAETALTAGLSDLGRATFESAAAAWSEWRDRQCAFEASIYEGGSLARVVAAGCRARFAAERALYLRDQRELRDFDSE